MWPPKQVTKIHAAKLMSKRFPAPGLEEHPPSERAVFCCVPLGLLLVQGGHLLLVVAFRRGKPASPQRPTPRCPARKTSQPSMSGRNKSWRWRKRRVRDTRMHACMYARKHACTCSYVCVIDCDKDMRNVFC